MGPKLNHNQSRQKAPKNERLTAHEYPIVQQVVWQAEHGSANVGYQLSRMTAAQQQAAHFGAAAMANEAMNAPAAAYVHELYTKNIDQQPAAKFESAPANEPSQPTTEPSKLDMAAIQRRVSEAYEDA